jgi:NAD-dependent SIR2 family protein deacetylase
MADTTTGAQVHTADCIHCGALIDWIECPTGSWWAHRIHPADGHDAHPANCPRCKDSGIDPEFSTPDIVTPGEEQPGSLEPCIACQFPAAAGPTS